MVKAVPKFIEPQLAKLVDRPPDRAGWGHEVKFDGYRAQLRVENGNAVIRTRRGLDWTERFSAIAKERERISRLHHRRRDRGARRSPAAEFRRIAGGACRRKNPTIWCFMRLIYCSRAARICGPCALSERKARLEKFLSAHGASSQIRYVAHLQSNAEAVLASACKIGLEGIISKKLDAPYVSGRSDRWLKAKCRAGQESRARRMDYGRRHRCDRCSRASTATAN